MTAVHAMPGYAGPAQALATVLGLPCHDIAAHRFPDGESLVRVAPADDIVFLYGSLDDPNDKLIELMLAASAFRDGGAARLVLVAPYMCYMRQDIAFHAGEAVSQRVVGRFLAGLFDRIVTVDPHLHRTPDLAEIFVGCEITVLSAAGLLSAAIAEEGGLAEDSILIGPDAEPRQWVEAVAGPLRAEVLIGEKHRQGDRQVRIDLPGAGRVRGRAALIVDDLVSSGVTLSVCAARLRKAGAARIEALTVHALCGDDDLAAMRRAGVDRFRSTDSVVHASNAFSLAPLLSEALSGERRS